MVYGRSAAEARHNCWTDMRDDATLEYAVREYDDIIDTAAGRPLRVLTVKRGSTNG